MLQAALEAEVDAFLDEHRQRRDAIGRHPVVRNGYLPPRKDVTGAGPLEIRQPQARDNNLGVLMRSRFGMGTPRGLQQSEGDDGGDVGLVQFAYLRVWIAVETIYKRWACAITISDLPPPIEWVPAAFV